MQARGLRLRVFNLHVRHVVPACAWRDNPLLPLDGRLLGPPNRFFVSLAPWICAMRFRVVNGVVVGWRPFRPSGCFSHLF